MLKQTQPQRPVPHILICPFWETLQSINISSSISFIPTKQHAVPYDPALARLFPFCTSPTMSAMRTLALLVAVTGIAQASAVIPPRNEEAPALVPRGESPLYGQCGGKNWSGTTNCVAGATCFAKEEYYHQCVPATSSAAAAAPAAAPSTKQAGGGGGSVKLYGQCGAGKGDWTGPTTCAEGTCQAIQEYYSQ